MDSDQLKAYLISGQPVRYNDSDYKCISAIIYRRDANGKIFLQAELLDKNENSVIIARPDWVTVKEETTCQLPNSAQQF